MTGEEEERFSPRQESFATWTVLLAFSAVLTILVIAFGMWVFA